MATAFAGKAVECRAVRAAASTSVPCTRLRTQRLSFTSAVQGTPVVQRTAEIRAQRASVCAKAAYKAPADNANEEDMYEHDDSYQERVVQIRRVTKVVKGGKQLGFRAVVSIVDYSVVACTITCGTGDSNHSKTIQFIFISLVYFYF